MSIRINPGAGVQGLTANTVPYANGSASLTSSSVTATELGYLAGASSNLQAQISAKQTSPVWANFTPTVTLVGGAGNQTPVYTTNSARYCQIGKIVFIEVYLTGDGGNEGAGSGVINIALPVAAGANVVAGGVGINDGIIGGARNSGTLWHLGGLIAAGASTISLNYWPDATSTAVFTGDQQNNATRVIRIKTFYEVD